jgi:hypothetical protein
LFKAGHVAPSNSRPDDVDSECILNDDDITVNNDTGNITTVATIAVPQVCFDFFAHLINGNMAAWYDFAKVGASRTCGMIDSYVL